MFYLIVLSTAVFFYTKYFLKIILFLFYAEVSFAVGNILN